MVVSVPLVPYSDRNLHDLVANNIPVLTGNLHPQPPVSPQAVPEKSSWWGWGVSLLVGSSESSNAAQNVLYQPNAPNQEKTQAFYKREIRFIDSKIVELETKASELNEEINQCADKILKFRLESELCAMEEVLLAMKYDLIKDIQELAAIKFAKFPSIRDQKIMQAEERKASYQLEENTILDFHDYFEKEKGVVHAWGESVYTGGSFPSIAERRADIEREIGIQPSYDFLAARSSRTYELEQKKKGYDEVLGTHDTPGTGQWPVVNEAISPADRAALTRQRNEVTVELERSRKIDSEQTLSALRQELEAINDVQFFQEQRVAEWPPFHNNYSPELLIHEQIRSGPFSYLIPAELAEGNRVDEEMLGELVIKTAEVKTNLMQRITNEEAILHNHMGNYQRAAYRKQYETSPPNGSWGARTKAALGGLYSGGQGLIKGSGKVVGGIVSAASSVKAAVVSDVVADKDKHYDWMDTSWGQALVENKENLGRFSQTVNPLIDEYRRKSESISVMREQIRVAEREGQNVAQQKVSLQSAESDVEDLRIITSAAFLKRLTETMKPHYAARREQTITVAELESVIKAKTTTQEEHQREITLGDELIAAQTRSLETLEVGRDALTGQARSTRETQIANALAQRQALQGRKVVLNSESERLSREVAGLRDAIRSAQEKIAVENRTLAILEAGFEEKILEYQGLNPPARPLTAMLQDSIMKQAINIATLGYFNGCYISPAQFRLNQQLAEICYTKERGQAALNTSELISSGDLTASLRNKVTDFLKWADTHPDLAQGLAADLAISFAVYNNSSLLDSLVTGIRTRATVQAALGNIERQQHIAPIKLTEDDLQWIYLGEWVRTISSGKDVGKGVMATLGTALASGPIIGGLVGVGAYVWSAANTTLVTELTNSVANRDLRLVHSALMKVRGDALAEIAGQEAKLDSLETFGRFKDGYLRPANTLQAIEVWFSKQWTAIKLSGGYERALRVAAFAAPVVAVGAVGALAFFSLGGVALGPLAAIGIGAVFGLATVIIPASIGVSAFVLKLANGIGLSSGTWLKVKEARLNALFNENSEFGEEFRADQLRRQNAFMDRLHSLGALPVTRASLYDLEPPHVKQWIEANQEELNRTANPLIGRNAGLRLAASEAARLARIAPGTLSPRDRVELELAIKSELQARLLVPPVNFNELKGSVIESLNEGVRLKIADLDPTQRARPVRKLHPDELVGVYREFLSELPAKVKAVADASLDALELSSGNIMTLEERAKMIEMITADLTGQLEREWFVPGLMESLVYEFKVIGMRYDNDAQFQAFYDEVISHKKDEPDVSKLVAEGADEAGTRNILRPMFQPNPGFASGFLVMASNDYLYKV